MSIREVKTVEVIQPFRPSDSFWSCEINTSEITPTFLEEEQKKLGEGQIIQLTLPWYYTQTFAHRVIKEFFRCRRCGRCCLVCSVRVSEDEVCSIASFLQTRPRRIRRMLNSEGLLPAPCPFLIKNKCRVYPVRPTVCQTYPIVPYMGYNDELPIISVVCCPGGKELVLTLSKLDKEARDRMDNDIEFRQKIEKNMAKHREELKEKIMILDRKEVSNV